MPEVYWITGNISERKVALEELKSHFSGAEIITFDGEGKYDYLENLIIQTSCFEEKRILIIRSLPEVTGTAEEKSRKKQAMLKKFKKLLEIIPSDLMIIFNGIYDEKALHDHVSKIGKVKDFPLTVDSQLATSYVVSCFAGYDKNISEDDADFLIQTSGYDSENKGIGIDVLKLAIKKIHFYIGNRRKNVTRDDLVNTMYNSEEFIIWRLFNAFDAKNVEQCYEVLSKMILEYGGVGEAVLSIYNLSSWRYRMLFLIQEELSKKTSKNDVVNKMLEFKKLEAEDKLGWHAKFNTEKNNDGTEKCAFTSYSLNESIFGKNNYNPLIGIYNRKDLYRIIQTLQYGVRELRFYIGNKYNDASIMLIADALILSICGQTDDNTLNVLRTSLWGEI